MPTAAPAARPPHALLVAAAWALATTLTLVLVRQSYWWIGGDDGWLHIRIAAELRERGTLYLDGLPWLRESTLATAWGDKELLFHWFLIPFAAGDLLSGAKLAHSLLNGMVAGTIAFVATRAAGRSGWIAPLVTLAITVHFLVRMDQLRPHLLSLALLVALAHEAAARRRSTIFLICFLYSLSYTAWQAPLLLCGACLVAFGVVRREWRWELLYAPLAGILVGILAHPGFPDNVGIWLLQNVTYFQVRGELPVGTEIWGQDPVGFLQSNWTGLVLLGLLVATRTSRGAGAASDLEIVLGVFAAATVALYLGAIRFAEYAIPFAVLYGVALHARLAPRGRMISLGAAQRALPWLAAGGVFATMHLGTAVEVMRLNHGLALLQQEDVQRLRRALPEGATVASTWDFTPYYVFAAPRARYLNALDPIFMAAPYPAAYRTLERIHSGLVADIPAALRSELGSDYIAYNLIAFPALARRAATDPRLVPVFTAPNHRVDLVDRSNTHGFVTDWRIDTIQTAEYAAWASARDRGAARVALPPYDPSTAAAQVTPTSDVTGCWWASRVFAPDVARQAAFGSVGPVTIYVDGERLRDDAEGNAGVIDAVRLVLPAGSRPVEVAVRSCPDRTFGSGFFWRSLER